MNGERYLLQRRRFSFDPSTWIWQPVSDICDLQYVKGALMRIDRWRVTIRRMVEVVSDFAVCVVPIIALSRFVFA